MLNAVIAVIGPPAAGKTTLTVYLGQDPGRCVFRLRDHVPRTILAATATSAERLGWIDDVTVTMTLRTYLASVSGNSAVDTVLFDNFPGSGQQARILLSTIAKMVPGCTIRVLELVADPATLLGRSRARRVCHRCEHDPIHDPRLPAVPSPADSRRCARCGNVLHPRRGDAPRLFTARMQRHQQAAEGIREAFASAGIAVLRIDSNRPLERIAGALTGD